MAGIQFIENSQQLDNILSTAGAKLVVIDFHAAWCAPCMNIAPRFNDLSRKYPKAVFLKVDVDQCGDISQNYKVTAMPTFVFIRNKITVDTLKGADPAALEGKIKQHYSDEDDVESPVKGFVDLNQFILTAGSECLNEADEHPLAHAMTTKGGYLESDCDAQLIISFLFNQSVKIHSLRIVGPKDKGPKTLKLFINQTRTLDFDQADTMAPVQTIELTGEDIIDGSIVALKFVKFQNVQNITVFVKDNQSDCDVTQIDYLSFIGSPLTSTNMAEFKRVAGKKGESH